MALAVDQTLEIPFGPRDAGMPMDLDEFENADFELGYRYELIHRVLVVTPSPLEEERDANQVLGYWLLGYQETHPDGKSLDLTLPEHNLRTVGQNQRCDRAIWSGVGHLPKTRGRPPEERDVPTIVVEFPSSRPADQRRDYIEKRDEYRQIGVREYWIIDRFRRRMTVYFWHDSNWTQRELDEKETYRTDLLPGFEVPLPKIFAASDKYRDVES